MKLLFGRSMKHSISCKFIFFLASLAFMLSIEHAHGFMYRPKHFKSYTNDYKVYIAPQISRLKFQIENFAIYRGVSKGISAGIEYRPVFWFYGGLFADYVMGPCASENKMSRYMHDVDGQFRFGYTFPMWNFHRLTLTLFSGLGYNQITQQLHADLVISSEKFRYYNYYIPTGTVIDIRVSDVFGFGYVLYWRPSINERLDTQYINGARFDLRRKAGYCFEAPFNFFFGEKAKFLLSLVPYLKRSVDGRMFARLPNQATIGLPKQDYKYWGIKLALSATF